MLVLPVLTPAFHLWDIIFLSEDNSTSLCKDFEKHLSLNNTSNFNMLFHKYSYKNLSDSHIYDLNRNLSRYLNKIKSNTSILSLRNNGFYNFKINTKAKKNLFLRMTFIDGLYLSVVLKELQASSLYRKSVINQWNGISKSKIVCKNNSSICDTNDRINLLFCCMLDNAQNLIDFSWNSKLCREIIDQIHMDTLMSWLSTLGGACSALGDYSTDFAERAEKISFEQLKIATKLGDPSITSRCRLYASIALIQKQLFKVCSLSFFLILI